MTRAFHTGVIRVAGAVRGVCLAVGCAVVLMSALAASAGAQEDAARRDSLFRRAQRLVNDGDGVAGRALVDSLLRTTREGSVARAEALYWRATLSVAPADARRDYLLIVVEHDLSPRAPEALLQLAQLALSSGDRASARTALEQLVSQYRSSSAATEGWFRLGPIRLDAGELAAGCAALDSARARLAANDAERRNQVNFRGQACRALSAARSGDSARADSMRRGDAQRGAETTRGVETTRGADTTRSVDTTRGADTSQRAMASRAADAGRRDSARDSVARPTPTGRWSVQVAAYRTRPEAERLAATLKTRGYESRVAALTLFHVRVGRFATRAEATALVARMKQRGITAIVVEAEPRAP